MTDQLTNQFLSEASRSPYPFAGPADPFTLAIVDASVTTSVPGDIVLLTDFNPVTGRFAVSAASTVIVALTDPTVRTVFGAYTVLEAVTAQGQVALSFLTANAPPAVTGAVYEFVPKVVTYGSAELLTSVFSGTTEVVTVGGILTLVASANMDLVTTVDSNGNAVVTINAEFDSALPCQEAGIVTHVSEITTVNGVAPDSNGNLTLNGKGVWLVEKIPSVSALRLTTIGAPCCDCPDYVTTFENMRVVASDLKNVWIKVREAQSAYQQQLAYVRFLLQAPIVGSVLPGETDRIATP